MKEFKKKNDFEIPLRLSLGAPILLKNFRNVSAAFLSLILLSCASTTMTGSNKEVNDLDPKQVSDWKSDIDFFHLKLEQNHIDLYHNISKAEFESELAGLKSSLHHYNKYQVMVEMMRITRLIGDGHTIFGYWGNGYYRFPIYFKLFGDDIRVIKTSAEYAHLMGMKLKSIDGIELNDLIQKIAPVVQGVDNSYSYEHFLPSTINVAEVLFGLKITNQLNSADFEFTDEQDNNQSVTLKAVAHNKLKDLETVELSERPLNMGMPIASKDGIWLSVDYQTNTAYIKFKSYPGFLKMLMFSNKVKKELIKNEIKNLIVDFRENGGGNFFEGLVLAQMLVSVDNLDWENGIYVLIGKETFSAGVSNAAQYKQILNAKLVGEPTGGNPYGYQDADRFLLPNANWPVQFSKRLFRMQDNQTPGLVPDVHVETLWSDYKESRDKQLEWVLTDISSRQVQDAGQID